MINRLAALVASKTVDTTAAASEEILFGEFAMGMIQVPAGSALTTLTWHTAEKKGGTYLAAYDETNAEVSQTVAAGKSYQLPVALAGAIAIKAVGNAAGTIDITLKG